MGTIIAIAIFFFWLYQYLKEDEYDEDSERSNCCYALIWDETDICSSCKEHCISNLEEQRNESLIKRIKSWIK